MLNWEAFSGLPGAADTNFEMLCRALIRRHYGMFGDFVALANQPGVEFDLKLHSVCSLGDAGRWYGWQCRWYDLPSGRPIGSTRRRKIEEAIAKTETELPGLTDWVLWTRHSLTEGDQKWLRGLPTHMRLHLWTAAEIDEHLSGSAEILRGTYFGELVLTPDLLGELHMTAVARIRRKWQPEVHQVVDAERSLRRALGVPDEWSDLQDIAERLAVGAATVTGDCASLPSHLAEDASDFVRAARALANSSAEIHVALGGGDYEVVRQQLTNRVAPGRKWATLVRRFRAARDQAALSATNVLADMHVAHGALATLRDALAVSLVAVVADAGFGKTELAAELTGPTGGRPAGILLHGADLHADHCLDDLAHGVVIHGRPVPTFEALVAAVNAAGQRACRRLPIIIDGLNEAEDPRVWKGQLAALSVTLQKYPYVLVVCTLRSAFVTETLPGDLSRLEIPGFDHDTLNAARRYFRYYLIDPADAELPWELLRHPLTLRMFCEVTNPERKQIVGVEAMPGSLTGLFDRYLEQVAERITELASPAHRYYESDVRTALNQVGLALWQENARSLDIDALRHRLGDEGLSWDQSIVRALEHDGVLLREPSDRPSAGRVAIMYDALAGHMVADALLDEFGGRGFEDWLLDADTAAALTGDLASRHTLATDISRALVGLLPRRMHRRQLWPLLRAPQRSEALYDAAWLEAAYLDRETVSKLSALVTAPPFGQHDLLDRLVATRAARAHPLDAEFLDAVLRPMQVADRDLRWTEWVRRRQKEIIADLQRLEEQWRAGQMHGVGSRLRARWVMWTLTSTVRSLRDHATRALYWFGCSDPDALFELTLEGLTVNDPYVPERMLAACYGVAMSLWADERGSNVRAALPAFANALVDRMFVPGAPSPTRHALMRDSALGVISLAFRVAPGCVPERNLGYLKPPFDHLPSPFPPAAQIGDSGVTEAKDAIHMDFGNYTIGRLIPERRNYDYKNTAYEDARRQIERRIVDLGYSPSRFAAADGSIGEGAWGAERHERPKIDRYGKKYSWIAYFEMYGYRLDQGILPDLREEKRPSDVDIDPSFPGPARIWMPLLANPFVASPAEPRAWLANGLTPDYEHLLRMEAVDEQSGPWVLLNGYVEQSARGDTRRVFTLLRGLLVRHDRVEQVLAAFDELEYPGNMAISDPQDDHYTYAGEISWSPHFGSTLRKPDGTAKPDHRRIFDVYDGKRWLPGIPAEVPVYGFAWESYHSTLNQVSGITLPAPSLCERLHLSNRHGEWDLYDSAGHVASLYREFKADNDTFRSNLLYLRADLLATYLARTKQSLVWLVWGERGFDHRTNLARMDQFQDVLSRHMHIHRRGSVWVP